MELTAEQIEQMAWVCYEAQRALMISRGLAALNDDVPRPWVIALESDKHEARCRVKLFWDTPDWVRDHESVEDCLMFSLVMGFKTWLTREEKAA